MDSYIYIYAIAWLTYGNLFENCFWLSSTDFLVPDLDWWLEPLGNLTRYNELFLQPMNLFVSTDITKIHALVGKDRQDYLATMESNYSCAAYKQIWVLRCGVYVNRRVTLWETYIDWYRHVALGTWKFLLINHLN